MSDESITFMVINLRYQQAVEEEVIREREAFAEDLKTILKEKVLSDETTEVLKTALANFAEVWSPQAG